MTSLYLIVPLLVLAIMLIVFYFKWTYWLHFDLKQLYPEYPISPQAAVGRLFIPCYNIWWLWHVYTTMGKYFIKDGGDSGEVGSYLQRHAYLPPLLSFICNVQGPIISEIYGLFQLYIFLGITECINDGIMLKIEMMSPALTNGNSDLSNNIETISE